MYLTNNSIETVGIDTGFDLLKYASERIDTTFIRAGTTDLLFKKDSFDLVVCIGLLHHFTNEVLGLVSKEISEVIKPRGIFVFGVKNRLNPVLWYKYKKENRVGFTLKARTILEMTKLIEKHGFEIIKKNSTLFPVALFAPFVIVFAKKRE